MRRLIPLLLAVVAAGFGPWGQEESGNRAYRRGDYEGAAERYREAVTRHGGASDLLYNLGTALLQLGDSEQARQRLFESLEAQSPELRARAFYNLGNVFAGAKDGGSVKPEDLRAAIDAYRRSLLLNAQNDAARWNLELAQRRLQELEEQQPLSGEDQQPAGQPPSQGEGEQERPREGGPGSGFPRPGESPLQRGADAGSLEEPLPRELAEQILRAVEEHERSLQREKLRQQRKRVRGPDW